LLASLCSRNRYACKRQLLIYPARQQPRRLLGPIELGSLASAAEVLWTAHASCYNPGMSHEWGEIEYIHYANGSGYLLCATIACFLLALAGIALLVWLFRSKRRP
jgi:hypothetical protein